MGLFGQGIDERNTESVVVVSSDLTRNVVLEILTQAIKPVERRISSQSP